MIVVDSGTSTLLLPSSHGLTNAQQAKDKVRYANDGEGAINQKGTLSMSMNGTQIQGYVVVVVVVEVEELNEGLIINKRWTA